MLLIKAAIFIMCSIGMQLTSHYYCTKVMMLYLLWMQATQGVFFYNYLAYSFIRGFCVASASVTHQLTVLASYAAAVLASTCI